MQDTGNPAANTNWTERFLNNGPLASAASAHSPGKKTFFNYIMEDLGSLLIGLGIPATPAECSNETVKKTNEFILHLHELTMPQWKQEKCGNLPGYIEDFTRLIPTEMVTDNSVDFILQWMTLVLGGRFLSTYCNGKIEQHPSSELIIIDPHHAAKHLVITTQYTNSMSNATMNLQKFTERVGKLDKGTVLLFAVQRPFHFITVATECTWDGSKSTISDSLGKCEISEQLKTAVEIIANDSKMVWVRDPLPLQKANNCFFYVATCMAVRLTGTQLDRGAQVWENFTAMFRVYAYLLVHRHARDRGVHAVTVPNVLQTWLNKNPALTESTPSSTTPS